MKVSPTIDAPPDAWNDAALPEACPRDETAAPSPVSVHAPMKPRLAGWRRAAATVGARLRSIEAGLAQVHRLYGAPSRTRATERPLHLRRGEVMRLTGKSHVREIAVWRGDVWLTGAPADGDVLLREGDRYVCMGDWPVVLQALNDAEMTLRP